MGYEIFEKKATRVGSPAVTFSKDRISLNNPAAQIFYQDAVEFVLLLWDSDNLRVALRPLTKKDKRAYKLSYGPVSNNQPNGASFSARTFQNHIGWKEGGSVVMPAEWNPKEGLMEFTGPGERIEDDRQKKLLSIDSAKEARSAT
jgi:hypothetical protein